MVLYLMLSREGDFSESIALLGIYAIAAFRLMPAMDGIFKQVANLRGAQAVVDALYKDLGTVSEEEESLGQIQPVRERLPFGKEISLENILFTYPGSEDPVIRRQSLVIPKNSTIGFAGPTGCGKTTLVDIILGLLRPNSGTLFVDGTPITEENLALWQANLGYVPQTIYLSDDTVARNIAFGVPPDKIDLEKVKHAARIAHRLTTLKEADTIFILDKGEIVERGTYNELLEESSRFRKMAR